MNQTMPAIRPALSPRATSGQRLKKPLHESDRDAGATTTIVWGVIPDLDGAVSSPTRVADDLVRASHVLELVPSIPAPVWGRDERHTGEMWNSNSVIAWLLARAGIDAGTIQPPPHGRAPGWRAGLVVAARDALRAETPGGSMSPP